MSSKKTVLCPCARDNVYIRGRCQICYQRVYRLVQAKKLTWRQAERRGIVKKANGNRANCGDRRHVTPETLGSPYAQ